MSTIETTKRPWRIQQSPPSHRLRRRYPSVQISVMTCMPALCFFAVTCELKRDTSIGLILLSSRNLSITKI